MNNYMVFAYDVYYPGGGVNDCKGVFTDLQAAKDFAAGYVQDIDEYPPDYDPSTAVNGFDRAHVAELTPDGLFILERYSNELYGDGI